MKQYTILEFIIPEWAICPLINGDYSALNDSDIEILQKFINKTVNKYGNANFGLPDTEGPDYDQGFRHYNDIDNMGSNCYKLLLLI